MYCKLKTSFVSLNIQTLYFLYVHGTNLSVKEKGRCITSGHILTTKEIAQSEYHQHTYKLRLYNSRPTVAAINNIFPACKK